MSRASISLLAGLVVLAGCGPDSRLANAADDLETASDGFGNRTNNQMDRIGNRIAPVIGNTIDRIDGNGSANASNPVGNRAD